MPTTVTGLLLFVALLLPGFAYVSGRRRYLPERTLTTLQQTVVIVAASVVAELAVLAAFGLLRTVRPIWTPNVGRLVTERSSYVETHYLSVTLWAVALLMVATGSALAVSIEPVRQCLKKLLPLPRAAADWLIPQTVHPVDSSTWWRLFHDRPGELQRDNGLTRPPVIRAGCVLTDGTTLEGAVSYFNRSVDETPDRELILVPPPGRKLVLVMPSGKRQELIAHAVTVSARDIRTIYVDYSRGPSDPPPPEPASGGERSGASDS